MKDVARQPVRRCRFPKVFEVNVPGITIPPLLKENGAGLSSLGWNVLSETIKCGTLLTWGDVGVNAYLTHLAVKEKVSALTHLLETGYDILTVKQLMYNIKRFNQIEGLSGNHIINSWAEVHPCTYAWFEWNSRNDLQNQMLWKILIRASPGWATDT